MPDTPPIKIIAGKPCVDGLGPRIKHYCSDCGRLLAYQYIERDKGLAIEVIPCKCAQKKALQVRDKNGRLLREGDIVIGQQGYMSGDGYLSVKAPNKIDILYKIVWDKHTGQYQLHTIDVVKEHLKYTRTRQYRACVTQLEVSKDRKPAVGRSRGRRARKLTGYREDMVCERLEKVTNEPLIGYANSLLTHDIRNGYSHQNKKEWDRIVPIYLALGVEEKYLTEIV